MEITKKVLDGNVRTVSRLIRNLEDGLPEARATLRKIFHHTGKAHVIGFTGSPGAGKSTLIDAMITEIRKGGKTVGVLLVDPSSPFTGGAILGDRVRMQRHSTDPGVFVRSLATRGALGGLSKAVGDAIHILDAMGKDYVIVETVGTGQQEVEIINHSHTVIVVAIPGMGDEIQAIKAGILEIADIFVINKADRDGAGKLYQELMYMLNMADEFPGGWRPPIIKIENMFDADSFRKSLIELIDTIDQHYKNLVDNNLLGNRIRRKATLELTEALHAVILDPVLTKLVESGEMTQMTDKVLNKTADPYTLAEEVAKKYLRKL
ncbi:MAG: methylmalonyl Co-A mutase-associated GTPase MeaB [Syntrophobacterales bacterium]|nr:methylmalonyl Co-A mutase-associated GTPase MeaB [Syntrophobacterales bacterium]OPX41474.1 MAG: GTPase [Desulfobacteraceae bacterium 4484_190.3]